jgi:hypothetical protein
MNCMEDLRDELLLEDNNCKFLYLLRCMQMHK